MNLNLVFTYCECFIGLSTVHIITRKKCRGPCITRRRKKTKKKDKKLFKNTKRCGDFLDHYVSPRVTITTHLLRRNDLPNFRLMENRKLPRRFISLDNELSVKLRKLSRFL